MRESGEDVKSEIERSIFNMVIPTRVGRERLFTCPVEMYFPLLFQVISRSCFRFTPAAPTIVHSVLH